MSTFNRGETDQFGPMQLYKPDYSFLTQVYNAKQSQYDTGFNFVKNLYNSALNNPLTSEDNEQYRQQVFKKIQTSLKDASSLDLSNSANIKYAQEAINPIVKDKELVYDMSITARHQGEMRKLDMTRSSLDPKISSQYNPISRKAIEFATADLRSAKRGDDSIFKVTPQKFIPYQDVVAELNKSYKDQGLNIEVQKISGDGYIYKSSNGKLAYAPFTKWAMQIMGNKYDDQFAQQGYVEAETMIRNTMAGDGLSREDAIRTFAPKVVQQLTEDAITNGTYSDEKIKEYDIAISKYRDKYSGKKIDLATKAKYDSILKSRQNYVENLAASKTELLNLQENGVEFVASNLYNIATNNAKQRTALGWATSTADVTAKQEITPDTTWMGKFHEANENARHRDDLKFKYSDLKYKYDALEVTKANQAANQRLAMLKLKFGDGKLPSEVYAGVFESGTDVPAVKVLQGSLQETQEQILNKAFSSSDGLITLLYNSDKSDMQTIGPIINKMRNIANGQAVKLTMQELNSLKDFGKRTGVRVYDPSNQANAAYTLRQMSIDVYEKSQKQIKSLKESKQYDKLKLKRYDELSRDFKSYNDTNDIIERNYNNMANEMVDAGGNIKDMYAGAKVIGFTRKGNPIFDTSGLSDASKNQLGKLLDNKYNSKTRPTGSTIIAQNVQPAEYNQFMSYATNLPDDEKNMLIKNLNVETIKKLYGTNADISYDPGKEEVIMTLKANPKDVVSTKIAGLKSSYEFHIPYSHVKNNNGPLARVYKYLQDNTVSAGNLSTLSEFAYNPNTSYTAPKHYKEAGLDYTVLGGVNNSGQYGIHIFGTFENPESGKKEPFEHFEPGSPGSEELIHNTEKALNAIKQTYDNANTLHDKSFQNSKNTVDFD